MSIHGAFTNRRPASTRSAIALELIPEVRVERAVGRDEAALTQRKDALAVRRGLLKTTMLAHVARFESSMVATSGTAG